MSACPIEIEEPPRSNRFCPYSRSMNKDRHLIWKSPDLILPTFESPERKIRRWRICNLWNLLRYKCCPVSRKKRPPPNWHLPCFEHLLTLQFLLRSFCWNIAEDSGETGHSIVHVPERDRGWRRAFWYCFGQPSDPALACVRCWSLWIMGTLEVPAEKSYCKVNLCTGCWLVKYTQQRTEKIISYTGFSLHSPVESFCDGNSEDEVAVKRWAHRDMDGDPREGGWRAALNLSQSSSHGGQDIPCC